MLKVSANKDLSTVMGKMRGVNEKDFFYFLIEERQIKHKEHFPCIKKTVMFGGKPSYRAMSMKTGIVIWEENLAFS